MTAAQNIEKHAAVPAVFAPRDDIFDSPAAFEHAQRVAVVFSKSTLVPEHMRDIANCLIALHMARRLNEHPLTIMQNIYVVNGRPGWSTQYLIARVNRAGVFRGRISWKTEGAGKDMGVTASAILADTGEVVSATATMQMAIAEQWTRNKKYETMPEHMLRWRSAAMLIRLYAPDVMLGLPTIEEAEAEPQVPPRDVTPPKSAASKLDAFAGEAKADLGAVPVAKMETPPIEAVAADPEMPEFLRRRKGDDTPALDVPAYVAEIARKIEMTSDEAEIDALCAAAREALGDDEDAKGEINFARLDRLKQIRGKK